jgi:hypothetical protein
MKGVLAVDAVDRHQDAFGLFDGCPVRDDLVNLLGCKHGRIFVV